MNYVKKYLPHAGATVTAALVFLLPALDAYVSAHPKTTVGVLLSAVIAAYHATAPKDQQ